MPEEHHKRAVLRRKRKHIRSQMTVSQKIRLLRKEGKPQEQAVAIAMSMKRHGKLRK